MRLHRIIALMASSVACSSMMGQTLDDFIPEEKLTASDGALGDYFGWVLGAALETAVQFSGRRR